MTLTMPTRELVGLLADVYPFADPDDENPVFHRVIVRWDGDRLHALAGDGTRFASMSWGPDDGDAPTLFDISGGADAPWELAILPENAKEIVGKLKLPAKEGEFPLRVTGTGDSLRVDRDAGDGGTVAIDAVAMARPWDATTPDIADVIRAVADVNASRSDVAYSGLALVDFCNPKKVRQRGPVVFRFGKGSTFIQIGRHFRGAIVHAEIPEDGDRG